LAGEYYRNDGDEGRGGERGERRGRGKSGPGGARKFIRKPKVCAFCVEKKARIDYKQIDSPAPADRHVRQASTPHVHGDQTRATPGVAAVHDSGHTLDPASFPAL
jgi:hypothetical protein